MTVSFLNRHKHSLVALSFFCVIAASIVQFLKPYSADMGRMLQDFGVIFQFQDWPQFLLTLANLTLASAVIFFVNRLCQNLRFLPNISNTPMLSGALLFALIHTEFNTPVIWIIALLIIAIIYSSHGLFEAQNVRGHVFRFSAGVGIIVLLETHCLFVAFLPILMLLAAGKLNFRNAVISLIGLAAPLYFVIAMEYLVSPPIELNPLPRFSLPTLHTLNSMLGLAMAIILTIIFFALKISEGAGSLANRQRWTMLLLIQATLIASILFGISELTLAVLFVPGSIVFAQFFASKVNIWGKNIVIIVLCAAAVINQFI